MAFAPMKRESRPHGSKDFEYHPHKLDDPATYADNYDRIFKKGKYAPCPHDTDGDGDCHICARHPERCIKKQPTTQNP